MAMANRFRVVLNYITDNGREVALVDTTSLKVAKMVAQHGLAEYSQAAAAANDPIVRAVIEGEVRQIIGALRTLGLEVSDVRGGDKTD